MTKEEIDARVKVLEERQALAKDHIAELDEELKTATDDKTKKRIRSTRNVLSDSVEQWERETKELKDGQAKPPARRAFHW